MQRIARPSLLLPDLTCRSSESMHHCCQTHSCQSSEHAAQAVCLNAPRIITQAHTHKYGWTSLQTRRRWVLLVPLRFTEIFNAECTKLWVDVGVTSLKHPSGLLSLQCNDTQTHGWTLALALQTETKCSGVYIVCNVQGYRWRFCLPSSSSNVHCGDAHIYG